MEGGRDIIEESLMLASVAIPVQCREHSNKWSIAGTRSENEK